MIGVYAVPKTPKPRLSVEKLNRYNLIFDIIMNQERQPLNISDDDYARQYGSIKKPVVKVGKGMKNLGLCEASVIVIMISLIGLIISTAIMGINQEDHLVGRK